MITIHREPRSHKQNSSGMKAPTENHCTININFKTGQ